VHWHKVNPFQRSRSSRVATSSRADLQPVLPFNLAANLEHFGHAQVRSLLRSVFLHDLLRFGDGFPAGREDRHYWQTAMIARTLMSHGVPGPASRVLCVGAGNAPILFWLTTRVGRVFAADHYLAPDSPAAAWCGSMPVDPERHWPGSWNPARLVVQHMSPLELNYPDASFAAVVALHVLESLADADEVQQALEQMFRVLQPGGLLSMEIELQIDGPRVDWAATPHRALDEAELRGRILEALPWSPVDPLDLSVSAATRQAAQPVGAAEQDVRACVARHGQLLWHELVRRQYPLLALRDGARLCVPAHLALRKPG
jgi:SAM-dependent methyltransferase